MIQLENVSKGYAGKMVFRDLSWHLKRGQRVGLVGPNGAGKTTLLRLLSGRETPDAGEMRSLRDLKVGYLPQEVEAEPFLGASVLAAALGGRLELRELESELERLEEEMSSAAGVPDRLEEITSRYGEARTRFEALGGYTFEAEAKSVLSGLGFGVDEFHRPVSELSGGWRMRVALARLLLALPDLLLLDEPTNHLDLESLEWLEGWIAEYPGTVIVVSHDRYFLNRSARQISEMARGRLTHFAGDYDGYLVEKARRAEALEAARRQQDREIARKSRFIERFRYKNTKSRQVQSRIKQLEKIERIETESQLRGVRFRFKPPPRSGEDVIVLEDLVKRFGDHVVYEGIDLRVRRGERIALMGPNGKGKTTLLRVLSGELLYEGGRRVLGHNVSIGYYAQHQLDALDPGRSVLDELGTAAPAVEQEQLRSVLGAFLFSGDDVDKRVAVLSGGEKARLALAKLLMHPANLLLLDEPTNHLDLMAREVLEDALNDYPGTLLVVSHDRYFINRVVTETLEVGRRALLRRPGDYDEYERARAREAEAASTAVEKKAPEIPAPATPSEGPRKSREQRRAEAEARQALSRRLRPTKERLALVEGEIAELEQRLAAVNEAQADPEVYRDAERVRELAQSRREAEERLAWLYDEWSELGEQIAGIESEMSED